jgi:hypothetical protein
VLEVGEALLLNSDILLRLPATECGGEGPELYAKVLRPVDTARNRCLVHFTSVPPAAEARLRRLSITAKKLDR